MKHSPPSNHNGGPELSDDYRNYRHAFNVSLRESHISKDAKVLGYTISTYFSSEKGSTCFPGYRLLSERTGIARKRIPALLEEIKGAVHLGVQPAKKRGSRSIYTNATTYEEQIKIYCRSQKAKVEPSEGATITQVDPSEGATLRRVEPLEGATPKSGPKKVEPSKPKVEPSGGSIRQKTEDSLTDGGFLEAEKEEKGPPVSRKEEAESKQEVEEGRKQEVGEGGRSDTVGPPDNVVPLGEAAATLKQSLNAALGPLKQGAASELCKDMVKWSNLNPNDALADIILRVDIYGTENLMEAWQAARGPAVKTPAAYLNTTLSALLNKHGRRDLPQTQSDQRQSAADVRRAKFGRDGM